MTFHTDAIFEGGVLRPLTPLSLPEHEVVSLSIVLPPGNTASDDVAQRQRNILMAHIAKVESSTDSAPDGFSNRDHDRLIYGD